MAVKIRLLRIGRRKSPFYRIVVSDSKARSRSGAFIENLGYYNPLTNPADIKVNGDGALAWLEKGAIPTDTVRNILSKEGIMKKFHDNNSAKDSEADKK